VRLLNQEGNGYSEEMRAKKGSGRRSRAYKPHTQLENNSKDFEVASHMPAHNPPRRHLGGRGKLQTNAIRLSTDMRTLAEIFEITYLHSPLSSRRRQLINGKYGRF
jgi:hypothetical protein